jgi:uncharacterized protein YndB with AHSA1/START domain
VTTTDTPTEIITPPGEPVIHIRRFFKAPPELVFRAITEPEYLRRWYGPRHLEITVCEADLRVGGTWRLVHRAPDGTEFAFHGEFLELEPPRKRVGTWSWDGAPDAVATETMLCEPVEGGTMVVSTMVHNTVEARDMHVANGMEAGIIDSHGRLDELLVAEQAT